MTMNILFLLRWELVNGYCYVAYNVWNKMPESIFQKTRGQWDTQEICNGSVVINFTAAISLVSLWLFLFLISRELIIN